MFDLIFYKLTNWDWSNLRCWLRLAICFPHSGHGSLAWKWMMAMLARDNGDEDDNDNVDNVDIYDRETMAMKTTMTMLTRYL